MKKRTRAIVAVTLALACVTGARVGSALSEDKPTVTLVDGQPVADPPAPEQGATAPVAYTVKATATPPVGITCPASWTYFDDPAMHYGLCYPPGWGFTEFNSALPLTNVRSQTLVNLHLASADAFPWPDDTSNFDGIVRDGITDVELDMHDPNASAEDGCAYSHVSYAGRTFNACYENLDANGYPASAGPIRTLSVLLPLEQAVMNTDEYAAPVGADLLVIMRAPSTVFAAQEVLAWKLVAAINAY